ncbi:MAG: Ppx/GppA family phosphatase [Desulfuromonadales bacterium]|nr:Ppx/GppA family phosphatase [Desulfuromonadales bacterium]
MKKTRLAAIDIGTNSIRCIVVDVDQQGRFMVHDDEKATVRLGENLNKSGVISEAASVRALEAIARMRKLIEGLRVSAVEAVATSAIRNAANGSELVAALSRELGHDIRVISGVEEAQLVALSGLHNFAMTGNRYAMIDIGGGSVEIVIALGSHIEECYSLDLGAVLMTERFFVSDPLKISDYRKFQQYVRTMLREQFGDENIIVQSIIGSGGTMTSLAGMAMNLRRQAFTSVHGHELLRSEVVHLLAMLMRKTMQERRELPGLNPERADIIVAGCGVVDELMNFFGANILRINERGIREGLVISCMRRLGLLPVQSAPRSWRKSVLEFAHSCHFDEAHSRHVAKMALAIFDHLAGVEGLKKADRKVLESAALLHDIGYFITYDSHHKHSYHLIRHANLFGLTPREREMAAQVARYHRKALPKKKHQEFSLLSEKDQDVVSKLGGILRLCDGLDRRRNGLVEVVNVEKVNNLFRVRLLGTEDISVEIFGGNAKRDLFEKAFGAELLLVDE